MNKAVTLLFFMSIICVIGCAKDGIKTEKTNNQNYEVTYIFSYDGINVYRFYDMSRYHWFTSKGECITSQIKSSGKTRTEYDESL